MMKVYHICSNEIFEKFDKFYWKDLKVTRVQKNIFKYNILKKGKFIRLSKGNNLRKIFN